MTTGVSIVIPMYNGAEHVEQQLEGLAVAVRDVEDVEILVIDNRSTDSGPEVVRAWASRTGVDVRVVAATEKAGEPYARNVGWRSARHERILYCDADDVVSPTWASALSAQLEQHRYATGPLDTHFLNDPAIVDLRGQGLFEKLPRLPQGIPFAHGCNMGFQRSLLEEVGGFDESYLIACDIEIGIRAHQHGVELAWTPDALVNYRLRPEPTAIYRQARAYGRSRRRIDRALGGRGGVDILHQARRTVWLLRHLPSLRSFGGRAKCAWVAGQVAGELGGRMPWNER
ncbi:glycosyltransferase [Propioniciclava sinopodophylli]|uniref:Glycosyltransferase n=1 Tax=Propioniciclava sinopodophylli TaxID=1837344 RepID=A0A4Q9KBM9_9ACTN|nr:glycosyltransferase [Propioniciclava sinopodophylli]TBT83130.1 glycosyltransferase [Propioniciclava sinopodophylli]